MISIYSLGSGSKGNCAVISNGKTAVMVDAGLSAKSIQKKLAEIGLPITAVSGILLTHEHNDHIRGLQDMNFYAPVYTHEDTIKELESMGLYGRFEPVKGEFCLGDFSVTPFDVSHDAAHPLGFVITDGKEKAAYMTDTGYVSKGIMNVIAGVDVAVIESNHDEELLLRGNYPERLKRRILSDKGHLCNAETALTVTDLVKSGARKIMLAHISENNNLTELAYWTTVRQLKKQGIKEGDVSLQVALQRETGILQ